MNETELPNPTIQVDIHYLDRLFRDLSLFPEGYAITQRVSTNSEFTDIGIQLTFKGNPFAQKFLRMGHVEASKGIEYFREEYERVFVEFFKQIFECGVIKLQEQAGEFKKSKKKKS